MAGLTVLTNLTSLQLDGQNYKRGSRWIETLKVRSGLCENRRLCLGLSDEDLQALTPRHARSASL